MQTILSEIQETVSQYARIISQVIGVDVEIVDNRFVRIAGTGFYAGKVDEDMSGEGFVFKAAMETGETQVIRDPGRNRLCISCPKQLVCAEKLELCTPISLGGETIGVIDLICFTDAQRDKLLGNFDAYLAFLEQIAEFISGKAYERKERQRTELMIRLMNQVVDRTNRCVIILNREDRISFANHNAIQQLELGGTSSGQAVSLRATGDSFFDNDAFKLAIDGREFDLVGNIFPVELDLEDYVKIIVFNELKVVRTRINQLTGSAGERYGLDDILGESPAIVELKRQVRKIASSTSTVLVRGESGTGKEMVARAIHAESDRRGEPFVAINCGAIPDTLLESELFGYVKGAFTGADPKGKIGKFELASKGVLFLDEIGDMPLYLQVKLLRVLEEKQIVRIGSNNAVSVDIRIIAASHKNLPEMIREHKFREDLFYRLNVIPLEIPPLRERRVDIEPLMRFFIRKYCTLFNKQFRTLDPQVVAAFLTYGWPGNVRELENSVEFMINMMDADGVLGTALLPRSLTETDGDTADAAPGVRSLRDLEHEEIRKALELYGTSTQGKKMAARQLGIGVATLYRKLDAANLSD